MIGRRLSPLFPFLCLWALCSIAGAEWALRHFSKGSLPLALDERNLTYRYDSELGWFPREGSEGDFEGVTGKVIHYRHNRLGFRDRELGEKRLRRIAFLGDSFVWGYDVEASERFSDRMQAKLTGWEVLNLGVSGYGTDQEYLLLQKYFDRLQPDVVVIVFCNNDHDDNSSNQRYGGYYKPYFSQEGGMLKLQGVPVPKSINYYYSRFPRLARHSYLFRAVLKVWSKWTRPPVVLQPEATFSILSAAQRYLEGRGTKLVVSSVIEEPEVETFCARVGIPFVKLPLLELNPSGHWSAEGHAAIARRFLLALPLLGSFGFS